MQVSVGFAKVWSAKRLNLRGLHGPLGSTSAPRNALMSRHYFRRLANLGIAPLGHGSCVRG